MYTVRLVRVERRGFPSTGVTRARAHPTDVEMQPSTVSSHRWKRASRLLLPMETCFFCRDLAQACHIILQLKKSMKVVNRRTSAIVVSA